MTFMPEEQKTRKLNFMETDKNEPKNIEYDIIRAEYCPVCRNTSFIVEGRCITCRNCGWSLCC